MMSNIERIDLAPGVVLNYSYTKKFKTDSLSVNFILPMTRSATAHASILPRVLISGSRAYPTNRDLAWRSEELYSADIVQCTYKLGELINVSFSMESLAGKYAFDLPRLFDECVGLLGEIVCSPLVCGGSFRREYVELEKKNQLIAIAAKKNSKMRYAVERCVELMCKDEVFGIPACGRSEDIEEVTPESLYAFYLEMLASARIELFYFGELCSDTVARVLRERLLPRCERDAFDCFRSMIASVDVKTVNKVSESASMVQGKLVMGYRTGVSVASKDYAAFSVLVNVLSDSPVSKLFVNVREKLGLCYYCGALSESSVGIMLISSGLKNENFDRAQKEISAQISDIIDGKITADELAFAKKAIISSLEGMSDSPSSVESWYLLRTVNSASAVSPEEFAVDVESVTVEDVAFIAQKLELDTVYCLEGELDGSDSVKDYQEEDVSDGEI